MTTASIQSVEALCMKQQRGLLQASKSSLHKMYGTNVVLNSHNYQEEQLKKRVYHFITITMPLYDSTRR